MDMRPGYKRTDVGVIPQDWNVASLGKEIERLDAGVSVNSVDDELRTYAHQQAVLKTSAVSNGRFLPGQSKKIAPRDMGRAKLSPRADSIIISRMNTPDLVGECGYVFADFPELFLPDRLWTTTRRPGSEVNIRWLSYLLSSKVYKARIKEFATGTSGSMKNIAKDSLLAMPVAYPSPAEQRAIAAALSDVDALLEGLDRLIAKKRDLKQAVIQQLLTGQTRLPGFQGEWVMNRLGDTATLKARIGWQGLTTSEYLESGDFLLVTGTEFLRGNIEWGRCHFVDEVRYKQDTNIQLRPRDVLVTKDGTIGKVALVPSLPGPATLNSGVFVIRPLRESFHPEFFYYVLCSRQFSEFLSQLAAGSTISHLYQKDFVSFTYRAPASLDEQAAIADALAEMDAELAALEARREKTRALKQGMMQELLTGRIRLV
jgi:type I restriction enzyme S subunit